MKWANVIRMKKVIWKLIIERVNVIILWKINKEVTWKYFIYLIYNN